MAKLEESDDNSAGLVSKTFKQVVSSSKMYELWFQFYISVLLVTFQDNIPLVDQQLLFTCCPFLGKCLPPVIHQSVASSEFMSLPHWSLSADLFCVDCRRVPEALGCLCVR